MPMHLFRYYVDSASQHLRPPREQLVGREGEDSGSPAGLHDGDGHEYGPTSISKIIWTLIQNITYLAVCYMCSRNEHTTDFSGLLVTLLKGRHGVVVVGGGDDGGRDTGW